MPSSLVPSRAVRSALCRVQRGNSPRVYRDPDFDPRWMNRPQTQRLPSNGCRAFSRRDDQSEADKRFLKENIKAAAPHLSALLGLWQVGPRPANLTTMASIVIAGVNSAALSLPARRSAMARAPGAKFAFVASAAPTRPSARVAGPATRGATAVAMPGAARGDMMMSRAAALDISAPAANDDKKQVRPSERRVLSVFYAQNIRPFFASSAETPAPVTPRI